MKTILYGKEGYLQFDKDKKVLVVDHELDITLTLKSVLENSGFNVDLLHDSLLALQYFKTNFYDLIILDIKMPKMNGFYFIIMKKSKW